MLLNILLQANIVVPDSIKTKHIEKLATVKSELATLSFEDFITKFAQWIVDLGAKLVLAIIVFYIGKFIIKKLYNISKAIMIKQKIDRSLTTFILSLLRIVLLFILIVIVISILGIETSSFIAIFASAGIAVGMALSGTLQNFAGGVLILLLKPYKVGDFIEVQGFSGTVKEILIFNTVINTPDNKSIIIPNGGLSTGSINNYSKEDYRRVEWNISIAYGDDFDNAKNLILKMIDEDSRIVKKTMEEDRELRHIEPVKEEEEQEEENDAEGKKTSLWQRIRHKKDSIDKSIQQKTTGIQTSLPQRDCTPVVFLSQLADSSIVIVARAWTRTEFYWDVYFKINERIYKEFPENNLNFPFPQMDVYVSQKK